MDIDNAILKVSQKRAAREALAEGGRHPVHPAELHLRRASTAEAAPAARPGAGPGVPEVRAEGRPNSPYTLLGRQLDRWLLTNLGVPDRTALAAISSRDSQFYREAKRTGLAVRAFPSDAAKEVR